MTFGPTKVTSVGTCHSAFCCSDDLARDVVGRSAKVLVFTERAKGGALRRSSAAALTEAAERLGTPLGAFPALQQPIWEVEVVALPQLRDHDLNRAGPVAKVPAPALAPVAVTGVGALSRPHARPCTAQRVGFALRRCMGQNADSQKPWWVAVIVTISCVRL